MKKLRVLVFLLYTLLTLFGVDSQELKTDLSSQSDYLVYEVTGKKNTVYLVGSVHVGLPEFYPFPDYIENAFENSDYLVVEVDITSPKNIKAAAGVFKHALIKDGKTLDQVISKELYQKVKKTLADFSFNIKSFNNLQPWFFSIFLPGLQINSLGYSEEYGVDKYFLNKAKGNKDILELETFMDQIEVFKTMNNESYLAYTLSSMEQTETLLPALIKAWQDGDAEKLGELIHSVYDSTEIDTSEIYNKLFTERDEKMAEKIIGYLNNDKDYFVVVGSGHLVGNNGIVSRLINEDFFTKQLE